MSKAEQTRNRIIEEAAGLFNRRGYAGASISDLMAATGLKKGGIYNHFDSKDALAIAAFEFAVHKAKQQHLQAFKDYRSAGKRLTAVVESFVQNFETMAAWGGCPLMNTAIESDDTHPVLRAKTQQAMEDWRSFIRRIVQKGIDKGEVHQSVAPEAVATILIATLEGALMMSKLYGDRVHLEYAQTHLNKYIEGFAVP